MSRKKLCMDSHLRSSIRHRSARFDRTRSHLLSLLLLLLGCCPFSSWLCHRARFCQVVSVQTPSTHGDKKTGKENAGNDFDDDDDCNTKKEATRKRERKVRLMHVSRPLMGGLSWAPENAGELDMITVDKYTAVLKSYPGERNGSGCGAILSSGADGVVLSGVWML